MRYEQQREHRTGTSRSHKSCQSGRRREFGELNPSPLLVKIYFRLSRFQSLLLLIHFRYDPNTCSHYTKVWHRTSPICGGPLSRLTWRGELNPNPYYRIFTSAQVDSSPHFYFTLPLRSEYIFTLHRPSTFEIDEAQLRSFTKIAPKLACVQNPLPFSDFY